MCDLTGKLNSTATGYAVASTARGDSNHTLMHF